MTDRVEPLPPRTSAPTEGGTANQVLAWVGIAAAAVFIVAVVFFSGFFIGRNTDGSGFHGRYHGTPGPGMMGPAMMGPNGPGSPGQMGPGQTAPNQPQPPTTTPRP
ncbi:MAG: hypothetical protein ACXWD3_00365 [Mycobacterium sp.]